MRSVIQGRRCRLDDSRYPTTGNRRRMVYMLGLQPQKDAVSAPCAVACLNLMAVDGNCFRMTEAWWLLEVRNCIGCGQADSRAKVWRPAWHLVPAATLPTVGIDPPKSPRGFKEGGCHLCCRLCPVKMGYRPCRAYNVHNV